MTSLALGLGVGGGADHPSQQLLSNDKLDIEAGRTQQGRADHNSRGVELRHPKRLGEQHLPNEHLRGGVTSSKRESHN